MKTVIIAPHPDDEWIGCGCTILKKISEHEKILVLIITNMPYSWKRIAISKQLANKYGYFLKVLGQPELNINTQKLIPFLIRNINTNDTVYTPSYDMHPDHRKISRTARICLKNKNIYEYAVYNNSLNPIRRIKNKLISLVTGQSPASFRRGNPDFVLNYELKNKNQNILYFSEIPRSHDVIRRLTHHMS